MIGTSGAVAVRAVDDLERPVVLAALAGDEDHVDVAGSGATRTVSSTPSVTPTSSKRRVVGQGPLDVEDVEAFDGDECADGAFHALRYFCAVDLRGAGPAS